MNIRSWKRNADSARIDGGRAHEGRCCLHTLRMIWTAVLLVSLPPIAVAQQIAIGEYLVPTANSYPTGIAAGPDGVMWFTEYSSNKIGRITTAGVIAEYPVPTANSLPEGIAGGPDGAMWFTEQTGNKIGRITTAGVITEYPAPTANSSPQGIATGPDGALWFTEQTGNKIGRITTAGVITEYPVPSASSEPYGITAGPDGALWFTEIGDNKIGRITTSGAITEYPVPTAKSLPEGIAAGPDGALWFTEYYGNKIGRITTAGVITQYPVPAAGGYPVGIAAGPGGALWFTAFGSNKIGEALFVTADLSVSPASGAFRDNITFTGTAFAPNESVQIYDRGVGSSVLASARADASGAFTVTARAPHSPYGPRLFLGLGQRSGKLGAANFSVTPRLILNPNSGLAGSSTAARGYGFAPLETVKIYWNNTQTLLGTVTANVNGAFTGSAALTFEVPAGAHPGVKSVKGIGQSSNAVGKGSFTVE